MLTLQACIGHQNLLKYNLKLHAIPSCMKGEGEHQHVFPTSFLAWLFVIWICILIFIIGHWFLDGYTVTQCLASNFAIMDINIAEHRSFKEWVQVISFAHVWIIISSDSWWRAVLRQWTVFDVLSLYRSHTARNSMLLQGSLGLSLIFRNANAAYLAKEGCIVNLENLIIWMYLKCMWKIYCQCFWKHLPQFSCTFFCTYVLKKILYRWRVFCVNTSSGLEGW